MVEQIHDEYKNVIFGRTNVNVLSEDRSRLVSQTPYYILVPGVLKFTEKRQIEFGRLLWEFSGQDMKVWERADDVERRRWSRMRMGRYSYVEIFTEGDEWWYRGDSSCGGNYPLSSLKIVKEF